MEMRKRKYVGLFLILIVIGVITNSCLEPFNANVPAKDTDVLVVEGYINAGKGITRIQLSKVSPLKVGREIFHESDAEVWIENDAHETFLLTERSPGTYETDTVILPTDRTYHLVINLSNGKTYTSEPQLVKVTPPIDSLHWEWENQLYIYANTHDDQAATHYYTWTYREDWLIKSQYEAKLYLDNVRFGKDTLLLRFPSDALKLYHCWKKGTSNEIILGSTRSLATDAISYPLLSIPASSDRIQINYSILVNQRAMTEDEYNYLMLIKKNTEQTGSFFDPMPSQLFGNIHRTDRPEETVIGYIGSYTTESMRMFISKNEVPAIPIQEKCPPTEFEYSEENIRMFFANPTVMLPYQIVYGVNEYGDTVTTDVIGYPAVCMDCRLKGGTNIHPGFLGWD